MLAAQAGGQGCTSGVQGIGDGGGELLARNQGQLGEDGWREVRGSGRWRVAESLHCGAARVVGVVGPGVAASPRRVGEATRRTGQPLLLFLTSREEGQVQRGRGFHGRPPQGVPVVVWLSGGVEVEGVARAKGHGGRGEDLILRE